MLISLINGIASDYLNSSDRAIHYGDGIFETILCFGNKLYYWQKHFQRLQKSAIKLGLHCPQEQTFLEDIAKLLKANDAHSKQAYAIKIILSRGVGERGYVVDKNNICNRLLFLSTIEEGYSSLLSIRLLSGDLFLCQQQVSINENLAGIKHLNRLENVLARSEWTGDKFIDGLMLNANNHIIEGTMSNLFAIKHGRLYTPALNMSGVRGVMRDVIIDIAESSNIDVTIKTLTVNEVITMDALFISNSLIGMKYVTQFNGHRYNNDMVTNTIFTQLLNKGDDYAQSV